MYDIVAVKIIGPNDRRITPWKNGQGWTAEIAISPEDATLESFDWRISIAGTDHGGPFSSFPGIDRTLLILKGAIRLTVDDHQPVVLDPISAPVPFPGELPTAATLIEAPIMDFNVMTRRDRFSHNVVRSSLKTVETKGLSAEIEGMIPLDGDVQILINGKAEVLNSGSLALFNNQQGCPVQIVPFDAVSVVWIAINGRDFRDG